ncbi:hypothetical protein B0H10DRAFT_50415 [Mycena sp. CBHHK59/15]|nr:hypothetical protein B0H10DRAFT_50415 [Mycena sp. CBHHK59/15]
MQAVACISFVGFFGVLSVCHSHSITVSLALSQVLAPPPLPQLLRRGPRLLRYPHCTRGLLPRRAQTLWPAELAQLLPLLARAKPASAGSSVPPSASSRAWSCGPSSGYTSSLPCRRTTIRSSLAAQSHPQRIRLLPLPPSVSAADVVYAPVYIGIGAAAGVAEAWASSVPTRCSGQRQARVDLVHRSHPFMRYFPSPPPAPALQPRLGPSLARRVHTPPFPLIGHAIYIYISYTPPLPLVHIRSPSESDRLSTEDDDARSYLCPQSREREPPRAHRVQRRRRCDRQRA